MPRPWLLLLLPLLLLLLLVAGCDSRLLPACDCPDSADPVCGVDGLDYPSACRARCSGVRVWHAGECGADGPATCNCRPVTDPVCGADRLTYVNACEAGCAGVGIASVGVCPPPDGGAPVDAGTGADAAAPTP